jgi:hypothetical protein
MDFIRIQLCAHTVLIFCHDGYPGREMAKSTCAMRHCVRVPAQPAYLQSQRNAEDLTDVRNKFIIDTEITGGTIWYASDTRSWNCYSFAGSARSGCIRIEDQHGGRRLGQRDAVRPCFRGTFTQGKALNCLNKSRQGIKYSRNGPGRDNRMAAILGVRVARNIRGIFSAFRSILTVVRNPP